jgi:hypothetical protein
MRLVLAWLVLVPTVAAADDAPAFVTLDRGDATSRVGVEASYEINNTSNAGPGASETVVRFEAHGQYVDPGLRVGGYAQFPITYVSTSDPNTSESSTGIGNAELGALYVPRINDHFDLVLRAGVTLPTGSTDLDGAIGNAIGALSRLTDFYLSIPHGTSLRLAASPLWHSGMLFARADAGIDINLDDDNDGTGMNADKVVRLDGAIGVDLGQFSLSLESVNVYDTPSSGEQSGGFGSQWINEGAVAGRLRSGMFQPYAAVVFPLDHDSYQFIYASLTVGLDARIP